MVELHGIKERWFRSAPVLPGFDSANIDADAGIMRDVVMVQEGPAKGHGVHLEEEFIAALVAYDQQNFSDTGLKARFGHPSASSETMGTQLGTFSNFRKRRVDGKMQAIADLRLLDSAEQSPTHPGMRSWVLQMAGERPDFIMSSIVFRGSAYYQRKANGHKHYVEFDDLGDPVNYNPDLGNIYVEFDAENGARHFYTDLVESGAATESLFSNKANPDFFVSRAHEWLDDNPDIFQFVKSNPAAVQAFLHRLGIFNTQQSKRMSKFSLTDWLFGKQQADAEPTAEDLIALRADLEEAKRAVTAFKQEKQDLDNRVEQLTAQASALQQDVEQYKKQVEGLQADLAAKVAEIENLKNEPAARHTGGDTPPAAPTGDRAYQRTPVYLKAKGVKN